MKTKLLMVTLLLAGHFCATAQIKKGSTLIGGNLSFNTIKNDTAGKMNGGTFSIKAGRAFSENVVWGVFGILGYSNIKASGSTSYSKSHTYGGGLFNRLYKPLGKDFYLYGETSLFYAHMATSPDFVGARPTSDQTSLGFTPGISYQVLDWAHLELSLPNIVTANYMVNRMVIGDSRQRNTNFGASTSLNGSTADLLALGFNILF
ncbi:outer membrane beta-barrel protein [Niabella beijingensis]|uniref:outer membrane beta-barrel protein n=1 Tax=Niabella beijingensis TaxID=2872700 RepID=UPI001CBB30E3|nr:outer membrane beta-barrel protein [Niabella beijingensis]MBZ4190858.1 hypothetical protein [Niabella beijingensis]